MKSETYLKKSVRQLEAIAWRYFSLYIRTRDSKDGYFTCISCGKIQACEQMQAGHYFPAGKYKSLKFDEQNVSGECIHCNYYSGTHLIGYRKNLINKIGLKDFETLEMKAAYSKRQCYKADKFFLINLIIEYKLKLKK